jgi:16S rRNA C1402 (ribose-2'-O) methylase RsmI
VRKLLLEIGEALPEAHVVIGRELTKMHEEIIAGPIGEICASIETIKEKGEFAIALYLPDERKHRNTTKEGKYGDGGDEGDD